MLPTKFWFIWQSGFRGEDFFKSANQKQELLMEAIFVNGSEQNEQTLQRTFQGCFLPRVDSFGKAVLEETIFQKSTNQEQELSVADMFVNGSEPNERSLQRTFQGCFIPSFDSFGRVVSEEKIFFFQKLTDQKQELPVAVMFLTYQTEMSSLYRGPAIDASYQVSVHLAEGFQRRRLKCEKITDDGCQVMTKAHIAFGNVS